MSLEVEWMTRYQAAHVHLCPCFVTRVLTLALRAILCFLGRSLIAKESTYGLVTESIVWYRQWSFEQRHASACSRKHANLTRLLDNNNNNNIGLYIIIYLCIYVFFFLSPSWNLDQQCTISFKILFYCMYRYFKHSWELLSTNELNNK